MNLSARSRAFATRHLPALILGVLVLAMLDLRIAGASTPAGKPREAAPEFFTDTSVVEADEDLTWHVPAMVRNHLPSGLYLDSLICQIENLGHVDPGASKFGRTDLSGIVRKVGPISAGDAAAFEFVQPAIVERANLEFQLYAHDSERQRPMTMVVRAEPGRALRDNPSRMLDVAGKRVEMVVLSPMGVHEDRAPAVLLIHGHGASARPMIRAAQRLVGRGWWVGLVSQPGYGASDGPADLMGPATMAAAEAALAELKKTPGVDPGRIAAWGFSRGATVAALLATRHPELRALIVQAGIYDLWAVSRETTLPGFREAIVAEAGTDSAGWRARSPLLDAGRLRVSTLLFHGAKDTQVPAGQASAYVAAIQAGGGKVEAKILPNSTHIISPVSSNARSLEFLKERFTP